MALTPSDWSHVLTIPESYTPASSTTGQTLVITEATIAKLSAGDQTTFWSNVLNGGGDVRICTDSGGVNQLPVEVVLLDNVGETCVIWTRKATYNGTGDLFLFIGKAGETQPIVTDPFGRNAVWADYLFASHDILNDSKAGLTPTSQTGVTIQSDGTLIDNGIVDYTVSGLGDVENITVFSTIKHTLISATRDVIELGVSRFLSFSVNDDLSYRVLKDDTGGDPSVTSPINTIVLNSKEYTAFQHSSSLGVNLYRNGGILEAFSKSGLTYVAYNNILKIGSDSAQVTGVYSGVYIYNGLSSDSYIATDYENKANQSTFFGTPTIAATGGGGTTANITSSAPAFTDTIASTLTGNRTAAIAGQLPAFAESVDATRTGVTNTVQITELLPAFTASIATTLTGNTTAEIAESLPSFTASINASTFPAGVTAASITELSPSFTSAINATLTINRDAQIAGISPAFTDIVNASLSVRIESSIVELSPAFSASISATIPSKWIDVIVPDATWTDRTNTSSTWVNIR